MNGGVSGRNAADFAPAAMRQIRRLDRLVQRRILAATEALAVNPRPPGVKKLAGRKDTWRIRVGDHRIVYEIHEGRLRVLVVAVGHRREVYG